MGHYVKGNVAPPVVGETNHYLFRGVASRLASEEPKRGVVQMQHQDQI